MRDYQRDNSATNILGYENGSDDDGQYIKILFADGSVYTYTEESCGYTDIAWLRSLAESGKGLNAYISRHKPKYASKA